VYVSKINSKMPFHIEKTGQDAIQVNSA